MSPEPESESGSGERAADAESDAQTEARSEAQRRRRLAEIFGDVIPEQTSDDESVDDRRSEEKVQEDWLKRQVPPHHG